jgi:hypothetical protein
VLAGQQKFHGGSVYTATDTTFGNAFFVPPYRAATGVAMAWKAPEALANSDFLML